MSAINFQQGFALFEMALTCSIIFVYLLQHYLSATLSIQQRSLIMVVPIVLLLFPFSMIGLPVQLPLVAYIRGVFGELSMVTTLLLWSHFFMTRPARVPVIFKVGVVITALLFYPLALGLSMLDPYAWGYGSVFFILIVAGVAGYFWWIKWEQGAIIIALAILCWSFSLHESTNLWDYLLDPILFIGCLALLIMARVRSA